MVSKRMEKSETVVLYFCVFFFFQICWAQKSQAGESSWGQENNEVATLQVMRKDIQLLTRSVIEAAHFPTEMYLRHLCPSQSSPQEKGT